MPVFRYGFRAGVCAASGQGWAVGPPRGLGLDAGVVGAIAVMPEAALWVWSRRQGPTGRRSTCCFSGSAGWIGTPGLGEPGRPKSSSLESGHIRRGRRSASPPRMRGVVRFGPRLSGHGRPVAVPARARVFPAECRLRRRRAGRPRTSGVFRLYPTRGSFRRRTRAQRGRVPAREGVFRPPRPAPSRGSSRPPRAGSSAPGRPVVRPQGMRKAQGGSKVGSG